MKSIWWWCLHDEVTTVPMWWMTCGVNVEPWWCVCSWWYMTPTLFSLMQPEESQVKFPLWPSHLQYCVLPLSAVLFTLPFCFYTLIYGFIKIYNIKNPSPSPLNRQLYSHCCAECDNLTNADRQLGLRVIIKCLDFFISLEETGATLQSTALLRKMIFFFLS